MSLPSPLPMNTTENLQEDRRMVVLVLLGLCLCLPHLYDKLGRGPESYVQPKNQLRMAWLETTAAAQGSGLYWLDATSKTWQAMAALELHSPTEALPISRGVFLPAYRLQADGELQPIPPPAQVAPIFFQPIPISQATVETLMVIPGIGRRLATSIIDYRDRVGGLVDQASLRAIEGIGEKKAATIAGYVRFD